MKRLFLFVLAAVLLLCTACAPKAPIPTEVPAPTPTAAPTPTPAGLSEDYVLLDSEQYVHTSASFSLQLPTEWVGQVAYKNSDSAVSFRLRESMEHFPGTPDNVTLLCSILTFETMEAYDEYVKYGGKGKIFHTDADRVYAWYSSEGGLPFYLGEDGSDYDRLLEAYPLLLLAGFRAGTESAGFTAHTTESAVQGDAYVSKATDSAWTSRRHGGAR